MLVVVMLRSLEKMSDLCVQLKMDFSEVTRAALHLKRTSATSDGELGLCQLAVHLLT